MLHCSSGGSIESFTDANPPACLKEMCVAVWLVMVTLEKVIPSVVESESKVRESSAHVEGRRPRTSETYANARQQFRRAHTWFDCGDLIKCYIDRFSQICRNLLHFFGVFTATVLFRDA